MVNLGYMNLDSYPKWVTLGPELELRLGRVLSLNPDLGIWFRDSLGDTVHLVPGATVNFRFRPFFIGGGAVRRISDWTDQADGTVVPKFQAGFASGPVKLTGILLLLSRTDTFLIGASLGIGF